MEQSVGGIHLKIEGFHRLCKERGFIKTQGVVIPYSNCVNLTLRDNVIEDIRKGRFHIWAVKSVFEAIEIMLSTPCGLNLKNGLSSSFNFSKGSVFDRIIKQLTEYHNILVKSK
ncbi:MAG: hypothetical protein ACTSXG_01900 [Alphaproteobacteria bacterium]